MTCIQLQISSGGPLLVRLICVNRDEMSDRINCSSGVTKAKNVSGTDLVDLPDPPAFSFRVAAGNATPALATLLLTGTVRFLRGKEEKGATGFMASAPLTTPIRLVFVAETSSALPPLSRARLGGVSFFFLQFF